MRRFMWCALVATALGFFGSELHAGKGGGKPGGGDPPADPAIAFCVDGDVHVMDEDGSNDTLLASGKDGWSASWSPDGTRIAFASRGDGIYVVNADGSGLERILDFAGVGGYVAWSPTITADGYEKIAFNSGYPGDLYVVNVDGTGLTNLTNSAGHSENELSWSPEADRIVVRQGSTYRDIVVHELGMVSGSLAIVASTNLTATGPLAGTELLRPVWAKTRDEIAVTVYLREADGYEIWIVPVSDPAAAYLEYDGNTLGAHSWSPDDSRLLIQSYGNRGETWEILDLSTGGTTLIWPRKGRGNLGGADWRR